MVRLKFRHTGLLVIAALIAGALTGEFGVANAASTPAATCAPMHIIGVRGSGETNSDANGYGKTVYDVVSQAHSAQPQATSEYIDYRAIAVLGSAGYLTGSYTLSVRGGVTALTKRIHDYIKYDPCGEIAQIFLVGYSQGAQVVGDAYEGIGVESPQVKLTSYELQHIAGVALIADPKFRGGQGRPINVGNYSAKVNGIQARTRNLRTLLPNSTPWRSYCAGDDEVCQDKPSNFQTAALNCFVGDGAKCPHLMYPTRSLPGGNQTATTLAAQYLLSKLNPAGQPGTGAVKVRPLSGPTGTVLTLTPTVPCPVGSASAELDVLGVDRLASASVDQNGMWALRSNTFSSATVRDPRTALQVQAPINWTLQVSCENSSGGLVKRYLDATFKSTAGKALIRGISSTASPTVLTATVSPGSPCPAMSSSVIVFAATTDPNTFQSSKTQSNTIRVDRNGSWKGTTFSLQRFPGDTQVNIGAQCITAAKVTTFYYSPAQVILPKG